MDVVCGGTPFPMDEVYAFGIETSCRCGTCWWSANAQKWFVPGNFGGLMLNVLQRTGWRMYMCPKCGADVTRPPLEASE